MSLESFGAYAFVEPVPKGLVAWLVTEAKQFDGSLIKFSVKFA
jgi:hypothetical protein